MSDNTQVLPENAKPKAKVTNEAAAPEAASANNKEFPKKAVAVGAGIAAGVGAIAVDAYGAEIVKEIENATANTATTDTTAQEEQTQTSTATATDSTATQTNQTSTETQTSTGADHVNVTMVPDHLAIANMPDNMSFEEAFASARQNMGSGALFEWRGELYHTCHPNEYDALPQEVKELFADAWQAHQSSSDGVEVVPEQEGMVNVFDLNPTAPAGGETEAVAYNGDNSTDSTSNEGYMAYSEASPVEDDYDNDYAGAEDFINPDDLVA